MQACFTLVSELLFFMRVEVFKTDFEKIIKCAEKRETCKKISLQKERLLFVQNTCMERYCKIVSGSLRWGL